MVYASPQCPTRPSTKLLGDCYGQSIAQNPNLGHKMYSRVEQSCDTLRCYWPTFDVNKKECYLPSLGIGKADYIQSTVLVERDGSVVGLCLVGDQIQGRCMRSPTPIYHHFTVLLSVIGALNPSACYLANLSRKIVLRG
uniref:Uncharacterized protein n=1 Tax=Ananas comosus var. bracteatus TaxID=296719 RepID=A0A6V7P8C3_ANACO|nr:unnamed protein product [Ananas comosus var. bracteatus]